MKKSELWESIILLLAAILLLPIWFFQSDPSRLPERILTLVEILQVVLLVTLVAILIRRVRRVVYALRNKNRR